MAASDPTSWTLPRLRIDREGAWFHEDTEVTHPGILANLRSGLQVDTQGHYLQIGRARVPVEVEDAPFVGVRVERDRDRLVLTLNDLTREPLAAETLRFGADGAPHCRVKAGRFDCRLSRPATYQLLQHVEYEEPGGRPVLPLGGARYPLPGLPDRGSGR